MEEYENGINIKKKVFIVGKEENKYILHLYIAGMDSKSMKAIENLRKILDEHLKDQYDLEIIDICQNPEVAKKEQIIASPTLIKDLPSPVRTFVGDMSDKEKILLGLHYKNS